MQPQEGPQLSGETGGGKTDSDFDDEHAPPTDPEDQATPRNAESASLPDPPNMEAEAEEYHQQLIQCKRTLEMQGLALTETSTSDMNATKARCPPSMESSDESSPIHNAPDGSPEDTSDEPWMEKCFLSEKGPRMRAQHGPISRVPI